MSYKKNHIASIFSDKENPATLEATHDIVVQALEDKVKAGTATELEEDSLYLLKNLKPKYTKRREQYMHLFASFALLPPDWPKNYTKLPTFYDQVKDYYYRTLAHSDNLNSLDLELKAKTFNEVYKILLKQKSRYT